jgi:hypothetical protein
MVKKKVKEEVVEKDELVNSNTLPYPSNVSKIDLSRDKITYGDDSKWIRHSLYALAPAVAGVGLAGGIYGRAGAKSVLEYNFPYLRHARLASEKDAEKAEKERNDAFLASLPTVQGKLQTLTTRINEIKPQKITVEETMIPKAIKGEFDPDTVMSEKIKDIISYPGPVQVANNKRHIENLDNMDFNFGNIRQQSRMAMDTSDNSKQLKRPLMIGKDLVGKKARISYPTVKAKVQTLTTRVNEIQPQTITAQQSMVPIRPYTAVATPINKRKYKRDPGKPSYDRKNFRISYK